MSPANLQWESDSSIGLDEGVIEKVSEDTDAAPIGRRTRQIVQKQHASKSQKSSFTKRKMAGKKGKQKEKDAPSTTKWRIF